MRVRYGPLLISIARGRFNRDASNRAFAGFQAPAWKPYPRRPSWHWVPKLEFGNQHNSEKVLLLLESFEATGRGTGADDHERVLWGQGDMR